MMTIGHLLTGGLGNFGSGGSPTVINNYITIPAAVAQASIIAGQITIVRGDTLAVALPLMGDISARTKLTFTAKRKEADSDEDAMIQVVEGVGLTRFNGDDDVTASDASLVVVGATVGHATLTISGGITAQLALRDLIWDCQYVTPTQVSTPIGGGLGVVPDVTRATS
ncbi:hypothetical protein [Schlesneria sp. T3-172]|uniref:hypothetical protein n=1 Tax=Schlesneria sphaerica TaxID=3373610 RepID=UPI0037CA0204